MIELTELALAFADAAEALREQLAAPTAQLDDGRRGDRLVQAALARRRRDAHFPATGWRQAATRLPFHDRKRGKQ